MELIATPGSKAQKMDYSIVSTNWAAVQAIKNTRRAPHQAWLRTITTKANALRKRGGPQIRIQWVPKRDLTFEAPQEAARLAKNATLSDLNPLGGTSPTAARRRAWQLIKKSSRKLNNYLDIALPGKHTKDLYDQLTGM